MTIGSLLTTEILISKTDEILQNHALDFEEKLDQICQILKEYNPKFDWVGFYMTNKSTKSLELKAYRGLTTVHTKIPFGKGICGQVAISNESLVIDDVSQESNYLSCNSKVKSEIVVPIIVENENIGQIDIDSNTLKAFNTDDEKLLRKICKLIAVYYRIQTIEN